MKIILKWSGLFLIAVAASWILTVGFIRIITLCFDIEFDLLVATGIWLCLWLLGSIFKK